MSWAGLPNGKNMLVFHSTPPPSGWRKSIAPSTAIHDQLGGTFSACAPGSILFNDALLWGRFHSRQRPQKFSNTPWRLRVLKAVVRRSIKPSIATDRSSGYVNSSEEYCSKSLVQRWICEPRVLSTWTVLLGKSESPNKPATSL